MALPNPTPGGKKRQKKNAPTLFKMFQEKKQEGNKKTRRPRDTEGCMEIRWYGHREEINASVKKLCLVFKISTNTTLGHMQYCM